MPSTRYGEIAPRVREICKKYELPYNTGPLWQQWYMVMRTIARLAFPGGKPRKKPGPYDGDVVIGRGESAESGERDPPPSASSNGSDDEQQDRDATRKSETASTASSDGS